MAWFYKQTMKTVILVTVFVVHSAVCEEIVRETFNVVPGGQEGSHREDFGGMACMFTYVCQGGTLEKWEMTVTEDDNGIYVCKVARPDEFPTSYLFFQKFEVAVEGARLQGAAVLGKEGNPINTNEYQVDLDHNLVRNDDSFQSPLNKIFAVFKKEKEEL